MKLNFKKVLSSILCVSVLVSHIQTLSVSAALPNDTKTASGWTATFAGAVDGKIELDSENAYDGEYSLKIVQNTPYVAGEYMRVFTTVSVQEGKTYQVGFYAKSNNSEKVRLMFSSDTRRDLLPLEEHMIGFSMKLNIQRQRPEA